jgi:hypothetical protein
VIANGCGVGGIASRGEGTGVTVAGDEVPPPGAGLTAVNARLLAVAVSALFSCTLICVPSLYAVVRALPFTCTTVPAMKPLPVTDSAGGVLPSAMTLGETEERIGLGLSTSRVTEEPLPAVLLLPVRTEMERAAPFARSAAGTTAVSCVALIN